MSLGDTVTTVCYPPLLDVMQQHPEPESAPLRVSFGIEEASDIIADLEYALARCG